MSYEDLKWINQPLYNFKDKEFNSNSSIELNISMNTSDNLNFNQPKLSMNIKSDISNQKFNYQLSIQDVIDLAESISLPMLNLDLSYENSTQIEKIYQRDKNFTIKFKQSISSNRRCVIIMISHTISDNLHIIMPIEQFVFFYEILKRFKSDYISIALNLPQRMFNYEMVEKLNAIENAIKILPSNISIPIVPQFPSQIPSYENEPEKTDFDEFLEKNLESIEIPVLTEFEKKESSNKIDDYELKSTFINKVLNNDISNYVTMITNMFYCNESPCLYLNDKFKDQFEVPLLPELSESDLKSLTYVSLLRFKLLFYDYLENGIPVPIVGLYTLKYLVKNIKEENIEFAYDLLMINSYLKVIRQKLEMKISDPLNNKSILHVASRFFTDPFCFSFINQQQLEVVRNCVITRYKKHKHNGFFKYFENILKENMCSDITEIELLDSIEDIYNINSNSQYIEQYHDVAFEREIFRFPYNNQYNLEQIIKYSDIELKLYYNDRTVESLTSDPDIIKLFTQAPSEEPAKKREMKPKSNNISKFCSKVDYINEIPIKFRDEFLNHISELKDNFDFTQSIFPLDELGENIIRALYVWNEEDKHMIFTKFITQVENGMSKDNILAIVKNMQNKDEDEDSPPWEI